MADALALTVERRLGPDEDPAPLEPTLRAEYERALEALEERHRVRVQRLWGHRELEAHGEALALLDADLFSEDTWLRFGLRRRDLVAAGAVGGAATGGVIDAAVGGASFLLGTVIGGAVGGVLGFVGAG